MCVRQSVWRVYEVCANLILGVINTCENFETKAKVTNVEAWHDIKVI